MNASEIVKSYAAENEKRFEVISQLGEKVRHLEEELHSLSSQSADKVRRLEEQVEQLNVSCFEAERKCHSMSTSFSWRLTLPLRVLRDAVATTLNKIQRRDKTG